MSTAVTAAKPWWKCWNVMRTDRKMDQLDDAQFRTMINLFCLAGEQTGDNRGSIPVMPERLLAVEVARGDRELLQRTLADLADLGIIQTLPGGGWLISNWEKRNADTRKFSDQPAQTRARQQKSRAETRARRLAEQGVLEGVTPCHAPVTPQEEEGELESTSAIADGALAPPPATDPVLVSEAPQTPVDLGNVRKSRRTQVEPTETFEVYRQVSEILGFDWEAETASGREKSLSAIAKCLRQLDAGTRVDDMLGCARYIAADQHRRDRTPTPMWVVSEVSKWRGRGRPERPGQVKRAAPVRDLKAADAAAVEAPLSQRDQEAYLTRKLLDAQRKAEQDPSDRHAARVVALEAALSAIQDGVPRSLSDLRALEKPPAVAAAIA